MYEELVKRLRIDQRLADFAAEDVAKTPNTIFGEAADAIESLNRDLDFAVRAAEAEYEIVRKHGRWIPDKEDVEWGNSLIHYRCSECKERPHFDKEKYRFILSPFCPNCGAKMDEVS